METTTDTTTDTQPQPKLTLNDVILMSNIINVASRRGAFEANEFTIVGKLHEKLVALIPKEEPIAESSAESTNTSADDDGQTQFEFVQGIDATN
jgi:hypothetical protein